MWVWIAIGVGSFLVVSLVAGLVIARVLGTIAMKISQLQETDEWAGLPPTRAKREEPADGEPERCVRTSVL